MDRLNAMEIFVCVADAKSFAKAAAILDISPASVTKAVQSLEDHLGLRLLQRTTRRLSLTPEGEAICEDCRRIISDVADLAAGDGSRVLRGRLRVDMPASLAKTVIIPVVSSFIASHPDMELVLGVGDMPVYFLLAFAAVWPVMLRTAAGVAQIDAHWLMLARGLSATRRETVLHVILPGITAHMLTGVRLAIGIIWIVLVPAEMLGVSAGLGYFILDTRDRLAYSELMAAVVLIGALGYALDHAARWLHQRWMH